MPLPMGLTAAEHAAFEQALAGSHEVAVTVQRLDRSHRYLATISDHLEGGQVTVDKDADVTRGVQVTLSDPDRALGFDSPRPTDAGFDATSVLRIVYSVINPLGLAWHVPLFTGPVRLIGREGSSLQLDGAGKESGAPTVPTVSYTARAGTRRTAAFKAIAARYLGETRFRIPESTQVLTRDWTVTPETPPWDVLGKLAESMGRVRFFDGRGVLACVPAPTKATVTVRDGDGGLLMSTPSVRVDLADVINTVRVEGATPKGATSPITRSVSLHHTHPLSPARQAMNGVLESGRRTRLIRNADLATVADVLRVARASLEYAGRAGVSVACDTLPIPHLEEHDLVLLQYDDSARVVRPGRFSIPLEVSELATLGYDRRLTPISRR